MEVVGYLLEELRDAKNFASFKEDVENCNIFIGSLIFIEELADKVGALSTKKLAVSAGVLDSWTLEHSCITPGHWSMLTTASICLVPYHHDGVAEGRLALGFLHMLWQS